MGSTLDGRAVIVTGAGRGIGAAIASDLAAHGARVAVADRDRAGAEAVASAIREAGGTAMPVAVDVADRAAVTAMIDAVVAAYGRLDVMFNNAGISKTIPFLETTDADWDRIMRVNGLGVMIGTQEAARRMIAQGGGGKIVNTASIAGKQGYPLFAAYCASKFAVVALTQAAARALAEHRITVNCFAPGVVRTELWQQLDGEFMNLGLTRAPGQAIDEFSSSILLGRPSAPSDLVGLTRFLCGPDSDYITGQTLMVDGGMVLI